MDDIQLVGRDGPEVTIIDCEQQSRCLSIIGARASVSGLQFRNGVAPRTPRETVFARERILVIVYRVKFMIGWHQKQQRSLPATAAKKILLGLVAIFGDVDGSVTFEILPTNRFKSNWKVCHFPKYFH